jgi:hypothetical protein
MVQLQLFFMIYYYYYYYYYYCFGLFACLENPHFWLQVECPYGSTWAQIDLVVVYKSFWLLGE